MPDDPTVVVVTAPESSPPKTEEPSSSEPAASEVVAAAGAAVAAASADVGLELGKISSLLEALNSKVESGLAALATKQAEITDCMDAVGEVLEEMADETKPEATPENVNPNPGGVEEVVVQAPAGNNPNPEPQKTPAGEPGFLRKMFLGR